MFLFILHPSSFILTSEPILFVLAGDGDGLRWIATSRKPAKPGESFDIGLDDDSHSWTEVRQPATAAT